MMHVKHVWCDPGDGTGLPKLGHIVRSLYTNDAGEEKCDVYADGKVTAMAYREPADRDAGGSGLTFWNIVDEEGSNW
jgi:hypothetical protein